MDLDTFTRPAREVFAAQRRRWDRHGLAPRLWKGDPEVWARSAGVRELANRLGWLRLHDRMRPRLDGIRAFAEDVRADGVEQVVLCGMGGSSLAPEVFGTVAGGDGAELLVLDSTHPDAVASVGGRVDPDRALFVISSKSGTTLETLSFFRYFWEVSGAAASRFVAITDPGSALAGLAAERGFRAVFAAPPDVGGRFSAMTDFGLVPAALAGLDVEDLLDRAAAVVGDPDAIELGVAWGSLALCGRDKLTIRTSRGLAAFPGWMEQLIAESLGKAGTGIVPVAGEPPREPDAYGSDRAFVAYRLADEELDGPDGPGGHPAVTIEVADRADLAAEMLRAEVATAAAGEILGIHPFDQPDVEAAKRHARAAMAGGTAGASDVALPPEDAAARIAAALEAAGPGSYVALQAFLAPSETVAGAVDDLRGLVGARTGFATTFGWGPRFLHSTGQLHKGGPPTGVFVQFVDRPTNDVEVPETDHGFGRIVAAQAAGDAEALKNAGRVLVRVDLGDDPAGGVAAIASALR